MKWLGLVFALLGGISAAPSHALTPLPDSRPGFFAGDWIGSGAHDIFCFVRLQLDGQGSVLVSNASGDWLGASIRWHNQRQRIVLTETTPFPAEPHQRLMPLPQLALQSGINKTLYLKLNSETTACELQLRTAVQLRAAQAEKLLDRPGNPGNRNAGK